MIRGKDAAASIAHWAASHPLPVHFEWTSALSLDFSPRLSLPAAATGGKDTASTLAGLCSSSAPTQSICRLFCERPHNAWEGRLPPLRLQLFDRRLQDRGDLIADGLQHLRRTALANPERL